MVLIVGLRLFIPGTKAPGGNFLHVLELCRGLRGFQDQIELKILTDAETQPVFATEVGDRFLVQGCSGNPTMSQASRAIVETARKLRPDILHRPAGQLPLARLPCRTVVSIADLNFTVLKTPWHKRAYKELSYWWTLRRADAVSCISEYTARETRKRYPWAAGKVFAVPLGTNPLPAPDFSAADRVPGPFWLTFGHRRHKNVETIIRALAREESLSRAGTRLVVVGKGTYAEQELPALAGSLGFAERLTVVGNLTPAQLAGLYQRALGLAFMSHYEGFGLPVLEAMNAGIPVISSDVCSLPEVAGDAAVLLGPDDEAGLMAGLNSLTFDQARRRDLITRGAGRVKLFSWNEMARKTVAIYRQVAGSSGTAPG